ncbi:MAG: hypothetical protein WC123_06225 [Bacilli bacterium]|nr:hypothetical protein [Bacilli bacterium]
MDEHELYKKLKNIFEVANKEFIQKEVLLFEEDANERCLCAQLMNYLKYAIKETEFNSYYVDTEYNRNKASISKVKEIISKAAGEIYRITCDLIASLKKLPEYIDGYILGVFYLIDNRRRIISLEYYFNGEKCEPLEYIPY